MRGQDAARLALLAALWGASFIFMRTLAPALGPALPFLLFSFAALHLPASYSAILNSATPLFAVLLSALWLGEPLTLARAAGLVAGMAGVGLVTGAAAG